MFALTFFVFIFWLSNVLILSAPDERYSRNVSNTKFDTYIFIMIIDDLFQTNPFLTTNGQRRNGLKYGGERNIRIC